MVIPFNGTLLRNGWVASLSFRPDTNITILTGDGECVVCQDTDAEVPYHTSSSARTAPVRSMPLSVL